MAFTDDPGVQRQAAAESAAIIAKDLGIALVEQSAIQRDAFRYRCVISNDMSPRVYEFCCNGWLYPSAFSRTYFCSTVAVPVSPRAMELCCSVASTASLKQK